MSETNDALCDITSLVSDVPLGDVFSSCLPSLDLEKNVRSFVLSLPTHVLSSLQDAAFTAMIIVNQVLFVVFIMLRAAATKGWLSARNRQTFITQSSLKLAIFCTGVTTETT